MKKQIIIFALLVLVLTVLLSKNLLFPCSGIYAKQGNLVLFASNDDGDPRPYFLHIYPGQPGKFGGIYLGFYYEGRFVPFGGMNEKGLCMDNFGAPYLAVTESLHLPHYEGSLQEKALNECATVEEVAKLYRQHNLSILEHGQWWYADTKGDAVIIEGDEFIYKDDFFQVVTNFYQSHPEAGNYPCWRFAKGTQMFEECDEISVPLFRDIIDAIHQSNWTTYTYIFDVLKGKMYIYHNYNFEEFILLDFFTELSKEEREYEMPGIFSNVTDIFPLDETRVTGSILTFQWEGKMASEYQLVYSTNPNFAGCEILDVAKQETNGGLFFAGLCFLGIVFAGRKKKLKKSFFPLLLVIALVSCQHDGGGNNTSTFEPEYGVHRITVEDLQPGHTYYWKVTARASDDFYTQTVVRTLTVE